MKKIYTLELLQKFVTINGIVLLKTYEENINRDSEIEGKCMNENCQKNWKKPYRTLYNNKSEEHSAYCEQHIEERRLERFKKTCSEIYGAENPMNIKEIKEKAIEKSSQINETLIYNKELLITLGIKLIGEYDEVNRDSIISGMCITSDCKEQFKPKSFRTLYDYESYYCEKHLVEKTVKKRETTNKEIYGTKCPLQNDDVKEKRIQTNIKKYGTESPNQNENVKNKTIATNLEKRGVKYTLQDPNVRAKIISTNLERRGVEHVSQDPLVRSKQIYSAFHTKKIFKFPSGNTISCQGYEPFCLSELVSQGYNEEDIITENVPEIWYMNLNGKQSRYFCDMFIVSENKCIEVKSIFTLEKDGDILFKERACKGYGYDYELFVYDQKGKRVNR